MSKETTASAPVVEEKDQLAELEHKYKLALADYQNLLKQTAKERVELALYANEGLILELLPVYENLKLSLKHSPPSEQNNWLEGVKHVVQQFKKTLEENGVKEIVATNDTDFDPLMMEAVEVTETTDKNKDNKVAEEIKGGYLLHNKVLIPARVAVYKLNSPHPAA